MRGVLQITDYKTPLTSIAPFQIGNARLAKTVYKPGIYRMEGVRGYELWQTKRSLTITTLERNNGRTWKVWMVDDPLHWFGMEEFVNRLPAGEIVCAGLGLGLMAHHMLTRNDLTSITIVELDPDVIRLIEPTLPSDPRRKILKGDFYALLERGDFANVDGILWDLAVGGIEDTRFDLMRATAMIQVYAPGVPFVRFGDKSVLKEKI